MTVVASMHLKTIDNEIPYVLIRSHYREQSQAPGEIDYPFDVIIWMASLRAQWTGAKSALSDTKRSMYAAFRPPPRESVEKRLSIIRAQESQKVNPMKTSKGSLIELEMMFRRSKTDGFSMLGPNLKASFQCKHGLTNDNKPNSSLLKSGRWS